MPRLDDATFLAHRSRLREDWVAERLTAWSRLSSLEQWALHDFYAPAKDLTDEQSLEHRRKATRRPQLPQRAGKSYVRLEAISAELQALPPVPLTTSTERRRAGQRRNRRVSVRVLVRPEVDVHKLARALISLAEAESKVKAEADTVVSVPDPVSHHDVA